MGQKPTETGPIEEESSVVEQSIVEATIILQEVIDEYPHSIDIEDLKEIMSHLKDAHTALDTEVIENPVFTVAATLEELYDGSCEGEMQAEAEAERQADAALELSAELASCDWESWE